MRMTRFFAAALTVCALASAGLAQNLQITVENLQPPGGFAFSPVWMGLHDGSFDVFDEGAAATGGITEVAELADASVLSARFASEQPGGAQTTFADPGTPPIYVPGDSGTTMLNAGDATVNRFFNYASMVVPSNDFFIGNDNALELFDTSGNFNGPVVINVLGTDVWDAGSEVNDVNNGIAFIQGQDIMAGADEGGVVRQLFSEPGDTTFINTIVGSTTAGGYTLSEPLTETSMIARITILPEPASAMLLVLCGTLGVASRRR